MIRLFLALYVLAVMIFAVKFAPDAKHPKKRK